MKKYIKEYYDFWFGLNYIYESWAKKHGIHCHVLFLLEALREKQEGCTQTFLCSKLLLPKQTVNSLLKTMESDGLVQRKVLESDKRNKLIFLTAQGRAYADEIVQELYRFEEAAMGQMTEQEQKTMAEHNRLFMKKLQEALEGI